MGYILEILYGFLIGAKNPESGVLFGPWAPIYGFASLILLILYDKVFKYFNINKLLKFILIFFLTGIIIMTLELLSGYFIEIIYGFSFWNYTDYKYNIGKYTSLEVGLVWGIFGIIFIYFIRPLTTDFIKKLPFVYTIICFVCLSLI